jgi:TPR repeat protein
MPTASANQVRQRVSTRLATFLAALLWAVAHAGMAAQDSAWQAYERSDFGTAAGLYRDQAERGDRLAQFNYAMMLFRREASAAEEGEALYRYTRAAEQGDAVARGMAREVARELQDVH